jgi:hypothetical protein
MIDKQALSQRFAGYSDLLVDCSMKEDLRAMSYVLANMSDEKYEELLNKDAFRLPSVDKLKGLFQKPGTAPKQKPGEVSTTPQQRSENIKGKYQQAGPSGKLLTMFDHKDVQNAYTALPQNAKKLVDKYTKRWQLGDLVGKSASEKEALFEDKGPAGVYNALSKALGDFSKKYDISLLPSGIEQKLNELKGSIETLDNSPVRLPKQLTPEEEAVIKQQQEPAQLSEQDIENDKRINRFLQVMDKHFKNTLQKELTPALKNEYTKMTGEVVSTLKGDIERGFRDSTPGAYGDKASPYAPKVPVFDVGKAQAKKPAPRKKTAPKKPATKAAPKKGIPPIGRGGLQNQVLEKPAPKKTTRRKKAPAVADVPQKGQPVVKVAKDKSVVTSEGVDLTPRMVEIDQTSEEIQKLSTILGNNKL